MKIRKVDDKPMVIHTKEKAKIHAHEPKGAKIKGSNIYTVERGPKTAGAKVTNTDRKKSYRKSTIHQSEPKNKGLSRFKQNLKESNTSIKTKNTNFHIAGRTGALVAGAVTDQVEGGQEVSQAAYLAYESSRPVTGTASKGAALFRKKAAAEAKKRIKKVEAGKKLAKKTAKKAAKDTAKTVAKETAKETAKTTAKVATKTATKAAATAAGTAVAPGVGTAIGMAAGYAAGVSIEVKDEKMTNRSRKIKFFLDKMKAQENQTDSVAKLVKDLIVRKAITWVKAAAPIIGLVLLLLVLVVAMIAVPVIAVIAILYNSPFALFLPPLESGDTVQTVTSAYVQEFNRDVNTKVNEHTGYDLGETFHNFNDHDYMVLEALSPRNLVVMDMKSGSLTIALGATEYKRYPKDEKPTKDNTTIGVSWEHGIYLGSTLSTTNFKAYKREYGTPEKIEDPVMEGTTSKVLNAGIGHIEETAGIGESGNCVLCGHNGSRYGTFFTPLNQISIGDDVTIIDKNGQTHIYEVTDTEVVNPYDNSIKTQGEEKELTLFTCSQKGTMRFVVRCRYKEAGVDE